MLVAGAGCLACLTALTNAQSVPGASAFTAPSQFPTSVFSSYYKPPSATSEPQPVIFDPILNISFPLNLTDPSNIPTVDNDPVYYPVPIANVTNSSAILQAATAQIQQIVKGGAAGSSSNCSKCIAALEVGQLVAKTIPSSVPAALVALCQSTGFASNATCTQNYAAGSFGAIWTQILALADVGGLDGQYICNSLSSTFCPAPAVSPLNTTGLFPKPKPANATAPKASGQRVKVLHLSDFHLDPRYGVGAEANCTAGTCCRTNVQNTGVAKGQIQLQAPSYGAYKCDTPYDLAVSALQAIAPLTGTTNSSSQLAWTVYTGDLVSHDSQNQLSRAYTEYTEVSVYDMFKAYIPGPVFPVLGNHDSNPEAIDAPHSLPGPLGQQQSWNYEHVTALWQNDGKCSFFVSKQPATNPDQAGSIPPPPALPRPIMLVTLSRTSTVFASSL